MKATCRAATRATAATATARANGDAESDGSDGDGDGESRGESNGDGEGDGGDGDDDVDGPPWPPSGAVLGPNTLRPPAPRARGGGAKRNAMRSEND